MRQAMATYQGPVPIRHANILHVVRYYLFRPRTMQPFWRFISLTVLALSSYFIISHFFVTSVEVVGSSMSPTLQNMDRYFLNRWVYHWREPRPGDVVVIEDPSDHGYS